ncbi:MAG: hypothetical protein AAFX87_14125 [Bacteroidota bacterium]
MKRMKFVIASLFVAGIAYVSLASNTNDPKLRPIQADCYCLDVYEPVCIIATGQKFSNGCYASCAGFKPHEWVDCGTATE